MRRRRDRPTGAYGGLEPRVPAATGAAPRSAAPPFASTSGLAAASTTAACVPVQFRRRSPASERSDLARPWKKEILRSAQNDRLPADGALSS